jgi:hypothetical protein
MKFDIATVVFEKEYPMIEVQAKSIARHVSLDIEKIFLINNSKSFPGVDRNWYGKFADCVEIISADELMSNTYIAGYCKQQICKIKISKKSNSDVFVLLDNKNWFVNDIDESKITKNNLIFGEHSNDGEGVWRPAFDRSFGLFNITEKKYTNYSACTPFFVKTETLAELASTFDIEHLIAFEHFTEFSLINAFIVNKFKNWHNYFFTDDSLVQCTGIWPSWVSGPNGVLRDSKNNVSKIIDYLYGKLYSNEPTVICAGCHRNTWITLTDYEKNCLVQYWAQQGLVSVNNGLNIIDQMIELNKKESRV